jgi:putative aminopeptidase FrvX
MTMTIDLTKHQSRFRKHLINLLTIQAISGQEARVVKYLKPILDKILDKCWLDDYGNLLGEITCGNGDGATVLLSAHMDTVRNIHIDRKLIDKDGVLSSSKGVLGGDDRAGVAIVLEILQQAPKFYNGKIKVAFSREEEIGCVGADKIPTSFTDNVDLAIVCDRRDNRDIVTSCGGYQPFCDDNVGKFFEDVGALCGMPDWKVVDGGVSDATVFSSRAINSVNLSVGFRNEHRETETLTIKDTEDTLSLIAQALAVLNDHIHKFGEVPTYVDRWASKYSSKSYNYGYYGYSDSKYDYDYDYYNSNKYYTDSLSSLSPANKQLAFVKDVFGDTTIDRVEGEYISINQEINDKQQEIFLTKESFKKLVQEYLKNNK